MNLKAQMEALKSDMNALVDAAKAAERDLTEDEAASVEAKAEEFKALKSQWEKSSKALDFVSSMQDFQAEADMGDGMKGLSIGERIVKSADFKAFAERGTHVDGAGIYLKAPNVGKTLEVLGRKAEGATITTSTGQTPVIQESGYRNYLPSEEGFTFLDLITMGDTEIPYSEYAQVISETDNADVVPEGELKPTSDLETIKVPSMPHTYADGFTITNQTLADDGALAAFMESRVRRHLRGAIERLALNGTGVGDQPRGIMHTTGTLAQPFDEDVIVTLARAIERFQRANEDLSTQAIVMNHSDIWTMRLMKDADGKYLFGNPFSEGPIPTPWGVPLVGTTKVAQGKALVGRFDSFNFLSLDPVTVEAFNQHKDYAQRNLVYVRAETRGRQLFYSPRELVVATIAGE